MNHLLHSTNLFECYCWQNYTTVSTLTCQIIVQQILLFFGEKHTYTTNTFINLWDFSFKTWFSPIYMRKNPSYTGLLRPARLLISEKSTSYTIKWSYTIIWQVRVLNTDLYLSYFEFFQDTMIAYNEALLYLNITEQ